MQKEKIVFIDIDYILNNSIIGKKINKKLKKKKKKIIEKLKKKKNEIKNEKNEILSQKNIFLKMNIKKN